MSDVSPTHVNDILTRYGFRLRKGDAKDVAVEIRGTVPDDGLIVVTALKMGIACSPLKKRPLPIPEEDKAKQRISVQWLAGRIAQYLDDPGTARTIVAAIVDDAVDGMRHVEEPDTVSPDGGTRVRKTDEPYDLSQYETLADFLGQPSGERTVDIEGDVMSWMVRRLEEHSDSVLASVRNKAQDLKGEAPSEIKDWISGLKIGSMPDWVMDDVLAELRRRNRSLEWFFDSHIMGVSFRDAVRLHRPDVEERLSRDIANAQKRSKAEARRNARIRQIIDAVRTRFADRLLDSESVHEITNAIVSHIRTSEDLELAGDVFRHPAMRACIEADAHPLYKGMVEQWLRLVRDKPVDFSHPLVSVFFAVDDVWQKDGRPWHLTIVQAPTRSTFGVDNWMYLLPYALIGGNEGERRTFAVVLSRMETQTGMKTELCRRKVAGLFVSDDGQVAMLSKSDIRTSFETDHRDGSPAPRDPTVIYADIETLCPELALALDAHTDSDLFENAGRLRDFVGVASVAGRREEIVAEISSDGTDTVVALRTTQGRDIDTVSFPARDGFSIGFVESVLSNMVTVRRVAADMKTQRHHGFDDVKIPKDRTLH